MTTERSNPTTAAEVELNCNVIYSETDGASHRRNGICVKCADVYARQRVEAFREKVQPFLRHSSFCLSGKSYRVEEFIHCTTDCVCGLANAIAALRERMT